MQRLLQAQTTGVDGEEKNAVMEDVAAGKNPAHLLAVQHRRQPGLLLDAQVVEGAPVALQHVVEEETDPRMTDAHGVGRPLIDVSAVKCRRR